MILKAMTKIYIKGLLCFLFVCLSACVSIVKSEEYKLKHESDDNWQTNDFRSYKSSEFKLYSSVKNYSERIYVFGPIIPFIPGFLAGKRYHGSYMDRAQDLEINLTVLPEQKQEFIIDISKIQIISDKPVTIKILRNEKLKYSDGIECVLLVPGGTSNDQITISGINLRTSHGTKTFPKLIFKFNSEIGWRLFMPG